MTLLRPYIDEDNSVLLDIEKLCPRGNEKIAETMDKSPDFTARYKMYDDWKLLVAEDGGKIQGWIGWAIKMDAEWKNYGYIAEVIVNPEFQRKGIATLMIQKAEKDLIENGATHAYTFVFQANDAANRLFRKNGYTIVGETHMKTLFTYKESNVSGNFAIRPADKGDIPAIVKLLNNYYGGWAHFVPFTPASFQEHMEDIPGYGMDKLWVALSGDNIVACAGLWDIAPLAKMYYTKEPASMRMLGTLFHFLAHFTQVPKIPDENDFFTYQTLVDYAFLPEASEAMENIIHYLNNFVMGTESISIMAQVSPDDPVVPVFNKSKPSVEKWNVYKKSLSSESVKFRPLYQDFRDYIL